MAVRAYELNDEEPTGLSLVEPAPPRRQDLRRERQRWLLIALAAMAAPFAVALVVVGVVR
jgi:hypothetical protein